MAQPTSVAELTHSERLKRPFCSYCKINCHHISNCPYASFCTSCNRRGHPTAKCFKAKPKLQRSSDQPKARTVTSRPPKSLECCLWDDWDTFDRNHAWGWGTWPITPPASKPNSPEPEAIKVAAVQELTTTSTHDEAGVVLPSPTKDRKPDLKIWVPPHLRHVDKAVGSENKVIGPQSQNGATTIAKKPATTTIPPATPLLSHLRAQQQRRNAELKLSKPKPTVLQNASEKTSIANQLASTVSKCESDTTRTAPRPEVDVGVNSLEAGTEAFIQMIKSIRQSSPGHKLTRTSEVRANTTFGNAKIAAEQNDLKLKTEAAMGSVKTQAGSLPVDLWLAFERHALELKADVLRANSHDRTHSMVTTVSSDSSQQLNQDRSVSTEQSLRSKSSSPTQGSPDTHLSDRSVASKSAEKTNEQAKQLNDTSPDPSHENNDQLQAAEKPISQKAPATKKWAKLNLNAPSDQTSTPTTGSFVGKSWASVAAPASIQSSDVSRKYGAAAQTIKHATKDKAEPSVSEMLEMAVYLNRKHELMSLYPRRDTSQRELPTEYEAEQNLAELEPVADPYCEAQAAYARAILKAKKIVHDRDSKRKTLKHGRFLRNPDYKYEKPAITDGNVFFDLPSEIFQNILVNFIGDSSGLLSFAASCQFVSEEIFSSFNLWDVNDGGVLNEDHDISGRRAHGESFKRTFTQVVGTQNPKYAHKYFYDVKATIRMIGACQNYGNQVKHLEFYKVPLLTMKVLETAIGQMQQLNFLRVEFCPLLDLSNLPFMLALCLPSLNGHNYGRPRNKGRLIDLDFRPYMATPRVPFRNVKNFALPAVLALQSILPIASAYEMTLAKFSSVFWDQLSKCHLPVGEPSTAKEGAGIPQELWTLLCQGNLSKKQLLRWALHQQCFNSAGFAKDVAPELGSKLWRCRNPRHNILNLQPRKPMGSETAEECHYNYLPAIFSCAYKPSTCIGCHYLDSLSGDKSEPLLAMRAEEIDQMVALFNDSPWQANINSLLISDDDKNLLRSRLEVSLAAMEGCAFVKAKPPPKFTPQQIKANKAVVFDEMLGFRFGKKAEQKLLDSNSSLSPQAHQQLRQEIRNRVAADTSISEVEKNPRWNDVDSGAFEATWMELRFLLTHTDHIVKREKRIALMSRLSKEIDGAIKNEGFSWSKQMEAYKARRTQTSFNRINKLNWKAVWQHEVVAIREIDETIPFESKYGARAPWRHWTIGNDYTWDNGPNYWYSGRQTEGW